MKDLKEIKLAELEAAQGAGIFHSIKKGTKSAGNWIKDSIKDDLPDYLLEEKAMKNLNEELEMMNGGNTIFGYRRTDDNED